MNPERWQRVKQIFEGALELPPERRASHVRECCAPDAELQREVESLLTSHGMAAGFLEHSGVAAGSPPEQEIPERFGRYEVAGLLGRGGMGVVYLARDPSLNRTVAIKVLSEAFARDAERLARFTREARILAALNHPNIAAIYSLETGEDQAPFLVLEYVEGVTLAELLRKAPLPAEQTLSTALQVARALEAAHDGGVIHRDLKPENIRVNSAGMIKVLDFGLARSTQSPRSADGSFATEAGRLMGTPGYMSPEQARGKPVDARSDLFALGCVLYACFAGESPFARDSTGEAIAALLREDADLSGVGAPEGLQRLIERCLAKDAEARPKSAREVRAELESLLAGAGGPGVSLVAAGAHTISRTSGPRHRLPRQLTSFIGRERELARTRELLSGASLLTLTGAGGCGKTRLALRLAEEVAAEFAAVAFVELGPVHDPALVPAAVAAAVGVKEEAGRPVAATLAERLCAGKHLLVLDNCEHMLDAVGTLIAALLRDCPQLSILTTSRESLGITGETTFRVPSLELPAPEAADPSAAARTEAVRLFVERARAAGTDFELTDAAAACIARICRRLDGIPLAIELAAARVRVLSVDQIEERLNDRFRLLVGGSRTAVERHQTLRAALDWSYGLLSLPEGRLLRHLSVFAGGFTLEAVLGVCGDGGKGGNEFELVDLLTHLVDKSLVSVDDTRTRKGEPPRYRLLETIRQYARERLHTEADAAESDAVCSRHLDHCLGLAERAEQQLLGPEQVLWLQRLEVEHENMIAALEWCNDRAKGDDERGLRMAGALARFWHIRGHLSSGRAMVQRALAGASGAPATVRAKALNGAGNLAYLQGSFVDAETAWNAALRLQRELGDRRAIAGVLNNLGLVAEQRGQPERAHACYDEALATNREIGNRAWEAINLNNLANLAWSRADYETARVLYEQALELNRSVGNRAEEARNLANLATVAGDQGRHADARVLQDQALSLKRALGDRKGIAESLGNLSLVLASCRDEIGAARAQLEALSLRRQLSDLNGLQLSFDQAGKLALVLGETNRYARWCGAAERLRERIGVRQPGSECVRAEQNRELALRSTSRSELEALGVTGRALTLEEVSAEICDWLLAFTDTRLRTTAGST
jgi:predicted ATPase